MYYNVGVTKYEVVNDDLFGVVGWRRGKMVGSRAAHWERFAFVVPQSYDQAQLRAVGSVILPGGALPEG